MNIYLRHGIVGTKTRGDVHGTRRRREGGGDGRGGRTRGCFLQVDWQILPKVMWKVAKESYINGSRISMIGNKYKFKLLHYVPLWCYHLVIRGHETTKNRAATQTPAAPHV
jgi:hypothetical protein